MKWQDRYEIRYDSELSHIQMGNPGRYIIVDKQTDKIIGRYHDVGYARKQAKRRFNKLLKKLDKILLG